MPKKAQHHDDLVFELSRLDEEEPCEVVTLKANQTSKLCATLTSEGHTIMIERGNASNTWRVVRYDTDGDALVQDVNSDIQSSWFTVHTSDLFEDICVWRRAD